jgi:hypothetical protein
MSLYGCNNKPRPVAGAPLQVQDGYFGTYDPAHAATVRLARWIIAPYAMSTECQYTKQHASDPQCSGCVHRMKEAA